MEEIRCGTIGPSPFAHYISEASPMTHPPPLKKMAGPGTAGLRAIEAAAGSIEGRGGCGAVTGAAGGRGAAARAAETAAAAMASGGAPAAAAAVAAFAAGARGPAGGERAH